MIAHYWPVAFIIAGLLGVVGQTMLAWVVVLVAGLLAVLPL